MTRAGLRVPEREVPPDLPPRRYRLRYMPLAYHARRAERRSCRDAA